MFILKSKIADKILEAQIRERKRQEKKWRKVITTLNEEHIRERKKIIKEKNAQIKNTGKAWEIIKHDVSNLDYLTEQMDCFFETEALMEASRTQRIAVIRAKIQHLKNSVLRKDERLARLNEGVS